MKLSQLEGRLIRYAPYPDKWTEERPDGSTVEVSGVRQSWTEVDSLGDASGVSFVCPICLLRNSGSRPGVHSVICWFTGVPLPEQGGPHPAPGRWNVSPASTSIDDLTFCGPGAYSVALPCGHGYVSQGSFEVR
jgi:hypothetical protein